MTSTSQATPQTNHDRMEQVLATLRNEYGNVFRTNGCFVSVYIANYFFAKYEAEYSHAVYLGIGFMHGKYGRTPVEVLHARFRDLLDYVPPIQNSYLATAKHFMSLAYRDLVACGDEEGAKGLKHIVTMSCPTWENWENASV